MTKNSVKSRTGTVTVEAAVVIPFMMFFLLTLVIGGIGVFQYEQVSCQAREAARYASVHGGNYQIFTNASSPTEQQIYAQTVQPMAGGMALDALTAQIYWVDQSTGTAYPWDSAAKDVLSITPLGEYVTNTVRVIVSYQWTPNLLGVGPITLQSTSEIPMAY